MNFSIINQLDNITLMSRGNPSPASPSPSLRIQFWISKLRVSIETRSTPFSCRKGDALHLRMIANSKKTEKVIPLVTSQQHMFIAQFVWRNVYDTNRVGAAWPPGSSLQKSQDLEECWYRRSQRALHNFDSIENYQRIRWKIRQLLKFPGVWGHIDRELWENVYTIIYFITNI